MFDDSESLSGYLLCPLCDAEVPVSEDDRAGDVVYCPYCQCPLRVRQKAESIYLTEDF